MIRFSLIASVLLILTLLFFHGAPPAGELGLCLPSPNQWHLTHFSGWLINSALLFLSAIAITSANKKCNFVLETHHFIPVALLFLAASNCLSTAFLSSSTLFLLVNAISLLLLLPTYESRNATREFFIIASLVSLGSMVQYAFIVMIPAYIVAGIALKSFRLRELIAFLFGLITPYWILIGLGLVSPFSFRLPESLGILTASDIEGDVFISIISIAIMALGGVILSLYNGVHLFSRNAALRAMHLAINIVGYASIIAVIFDFDNFLAYYGMVALWLAIELASTLSFYNIRNQYLALLILMAVFLPFYVLALC